MRYTELQIEIRASFQNKRYFSFALCQQVANMILPWPHESLTVKQEMNGSLNFTRRTAWPGN